MGNLESRLKKYANLSKEIDWSKPSFAKATGLKLLGNSAYTDGSLVYKFDPQKSEAEALEKVRGVRGVQQFVAFAHGVLVTELIDSKPYEPKFNPSEEQIRDLLKTLIEMKKRGVEFHDCNLGNLLYSESNGFTLIDVSCLTKPEILFDNLLYSMNENCSDKKFLSLYANFLDLFYDLNSELALETLNKYLNVKVDKYNPYKKLNPASSVFKKLKKVFSKYDLKFKYLSYSRFYGSFKIR